MAVAVAAQWIANFLVSWTFPILDNPYLVKAFHHGFAFWIYSAMSVLAAFLMWKLVRNQGTHPRTKWNRSGLRMVKRMRI